MEEQLKTFRTLKGEPYRLLALPMADTVSYTHLDVYKRQVVCLQNGIHLGCLIPIVRVHRWNILAAKPFSRKLRYTLPFFRQRNRVHYHFPDVEGGTLPFAGFAHGR